VPWNAVPLIAKVLYLKINFAFYMNIGKYASAIVCPNKTIFVNERYNDNVSSFLLL